MTTKIISILLLPLFLVFCDSKFTINVNDKNKLRLKTQCGEIQLEVKCLYYYDYWIYLKTIDGQFDIFTNRLIISSNTDKYTPIYFKYNQKETNGHIELKKGEILEYHFRLSPKNNIKPKIFIVPNEFIICNGSSLITDTIEVWNK